jgi:hypothetical protein
MSNCPLCRQPVIMPTKFCPHCGSPELIELSSQNIKICNACKKTHEWLLSAGQKPVFEGTQADPDFEVK